MAAPASKLFISYSGRDVDIARELASRLKREGFDPWVDFEDRKLLNELQESIKQAIQACDWFLLLLSPDSIESVYVLSETRYAVEARKQILPVLVQPVSGSDFPEDFNQLIGQYQFLDMTRGIDAGFEQLVSILRSLEEERQAVQPSGFSLRRLFQNLRRPRPEVEPSEADLPVSFSIEDQPVSERPVSKQKAEEDDPLVVPKGIAEGLERLRHAIHSAGMPEKVQDQNLVVGTWSLNNLGFIYPHWMENPGSPKRNYLALAYMTEIIRAYDILYVNSIMEDREGIDLLVAMLGADWGAAISDAKEGSLGWTERQAFIYDRRRVRFNNKSENPPLPELMTVITWLPPFFASFEAGGKYLSLSSFLINYQRPVMATQELEQTLVDGLVKAVRRNKASGEAGEGRNLFLLGDFDLEKYGKDPALAALVKEGLYVPTEIQRGPGRNQPLHYCQLGWFMEGMELEYRSGGWLDFRPVVYPDFSNQQIAARISDRLPVWTEFSLVPVVSEAIKGERGESHRQLMVYSTPEVLNMRTQPSLTSGQIIKPVPFNSALTVLEPVAETTRKVGKADQWLRVRDLDDSEGYVAAWYTSLEKLTEPVPTLIKEQAEQPVPKVSQRASTRNSSASRQVFDDSSIIVGRARGVDVFAREGSIDYQAIKKAGFDFVYIFTPGAEDFKEFITSNWNAAREAGLLRGAYRGLSQKSPPDEQAWHFVQLFGNDRGELPFGIDLSMVGEPFSDNHLERLTLFASNLESFDGRKPAFYSDVNLLKRMLELKKSVIGSENTFPMGYPLWLSNYQIDSLNQPGPEEILDGFPWFFWQYNGKGVIPNVQGQFALNVFNGSPEDLRRWAEQNSSAAASAPSPEENIGEGNTVQDEYGVAQSVDIGAPEMPSPNPTPLPRVILQSVILKDEKVYNSQSAHFTLTLFNPSGAGERTWLRNERWQVAAKFNQVDGSRLVTREIERKFPGKVAPNLGYEFDVTVRAPNPTGDYQVSWWLEPLDWQAAFETQADPVSVKVEPFEVPEQYEGMDQIDFISIEPKESVIKARKYPVVVRLFNKGGKTVAADRQLYLYLTLKRLSDDHTEGFIAAQPLGIDLPPASSHELTFTFTAPRLEGRFAAEWELRPEEGWKAMVINPVKGSTLTLLPTPARADRLACLEIQPPDEAIKARSYLVNVRFVNQGETTISANRKLQLHLTLKRKDDDKTLHEMTALEAGADQPPGATWSLSFYFKAPRVEGVFTAGWELRPEEGWKAQVTDGVRQTILTLLSGSQEKLPPHGAERLSLPEKAPAPVQYQFETFYRPLVESASQQGDLHRLDIHLTPRRTETASAVDAPKYQVVLTQYEGNLKDPQPYFYESPFELDEKAAPLEELGSPRAGKLLFDGLFSLQQIQVPNEKPVTCTMFGLQRALALGLKKEADCLRLQVRFNNQTPVVHNYRWEYLWGDGGGVEGGPLATSERLPFARVLHLSAYTEITPDPVSDEAPLRLLVAVASPKALETKEGLPSELEGLGPITESEVQALVTSLNRVGKRLRFEVLWDAGVDSLRQKLQDGLEGRPFQALHLLCHGILRSVGEQACLVFQRGSTGEVDLVSDQLFAEQLQPFFPSLSLVVLASCMTALSTNHLPLQGVARRLLAQTTIPAVVAMQDRLQIGAALYFAQRFYRRLVDTGEVDKAANAGRRELFDRRIKDPLHPLQEEVLPNQWGVPVLFLRVLNGRLFEVESPSQGDFETKAQPLSAFSAEDMKKVTDAMLNSAASQVGLQLSLGLPNLAQSFVEAMELAQREKAPLPKAAPRRLFSGPRQEDQRWWLVWAAALYRKHPARRTVLFARRARLRENGRLLGKGRLREASHTFQSNLQRAGKAIWYAESLDPMGMRVENIRHEVGQLTGPGPATTASGPEKDILTQNEEIWLKDDLSHQPLKLDNQLAHSANWRMALRGFESYTGAETALNLRLEGNLTWNVANPVPYNDEIYEQLLYGENPQQAFQTLTAEGKLDAESAALALQAVYPDRFLPFRDEQRVEVFKRLGLESGSAYSPDYAGYCALGRDLLADGDLGLEDLVDVHFFLQRLANGDYLTSEDLQKQASGKVRPRELRTQLRPVEIDPDQVDSDLVIRQSVLVQACAALNAGKHIILIGPPGTGKTTLAEDLCRYAHDWDFNRGHVLVTATADWTTFDTIGGYMPAEGDRLVFHPGIFLEAIAAEKWLVIDEINRADIDKAFGELFTVLSGQGVTLPYQSGERLVRILPVGQTPSEEMCDYTIPKSWRIIGTMNIYDKASLFAMSYAFMRRFAFINVPVPEEKPYGRLLDHFIQHNQLTSTSQAGAGKRAGEDLRSLLTAPDAENPLMSHRAIGPAIMLDILDYLRSRTRSENRTFNHSHLAEAFGLYVLPQLDGLEQDHILAVYDQLKGSFTGYEADPAVVAMFERIKELFPFVPKKKWEEKRR